ncbi:hypothetical protein BX616_007418 [Lobosporangium transversale]|uniref:Uncharacterized protein n=1 Tax=Lobosporangium transversale TaxID=64571 RepID=A0A1Y2G8F3_9FUNG|nr:hypothetical protein BCR41DRAFT_363147 [Lobosporangium transversale]KAF9914859.1 hypothetical protein BX616_007418 [Lobosporangium transversale]ORZ04072.1 hypothetical protein BCR41DRAFT_363147 [Lobosporangium transversale]|eukprot:XP_021876349.1 hypothetical protein BCR41DRAFT_363147 [Lobosporangium transversale]
MPSVIPEECLWLIISYLRNDRESLHSLLFTNRTFFRIAVSFLYASPFRLLYNERNCRWTSIERTRRYDSLVHVLIHSSQLLQPDIYDTKHSNSIIFRLPPYGPEVPSLPTPSTVDYLSYYTDMFHDPMLYETFMSLFPLIPNCYSANVIWHRPMVKIRNRIEYAMMDRVLPQVTSLAINMPIQVPRIKYFMMANLRRLELLGTDYCLLTDDDLEWERTTHTNKVSRSAKGYSMSQLDRTLTFIWDHQRLFGTLRELKIENKAVPIERQPARRLIELVEAMGDQLEVLDVQFWPEAVFFLERIPTRRLKTLLLHLNKEPEPFFQDNGGLVSFLSQCPKLEELALYTTENDLFSPWRLQRTAQDSTQPAIYSTLSMTTRHKYSRIQTHSEMKRIDIAGLAQDVIMNLNDATELFSSTLQAIKARSWFSGKLTTIPLSWFNSTLSRLTDLDLEGEVAWTFDYASLLNCPRLCRVRLAYTGPMPSRSSKKQPAIDNLPRVFTIQDLELVGNWETLYIRGWPSTIAQIHRLERLDLVACEGIVADQVVSLVQDIIEQSARRYLQEQEVFGDNDADVPVLRNNYCHLRWVIVNKRLHDNIEQQWDGLRRWLAMRSGAEGSESANLMTRGATIATTSTAPTGLVATASPFVIRSVQRVRFSYVTIARPTR